MRPPDSFSTFSIQGLCIVSHTFDCGAMKVWNLSVTACCARPLRPGAPSATAAVDFRRVRRWIMWISPGWVANLTHGPGGGLRGFPSSDHAHHPEGNDRKEQQEERTDDVAHEEGHDAAVDLGDRHVLGQPVHDVDI